VIGPSKEVVAALIGALIGSIISFVLLVAWDVYKDRRKERADQARAIRLVGDEVAVNIDLLESMLTYLTSDTAAAAENKLILAPLPTLPVEAWQATRLAGSFSPVRSDLAKDLASTYHKIAFLNQMIQARELYKATSQPLDKFHEHRKVMNEHLQHAANELLERLKDHREKLRDGGVTK
jgi:hypothetical protein